jgi:hypothetical protein
VFTRAATVAAVLGREAPTLLERQQRVQVPVGQQIDMPPRTVAAVGAATPGHISRAGRLPRHRRRYQPGRIFARS